MRFVRLHPEITFTHPDFDEVRNFTSLVIRVRDEADVALNIEFRRYLLYRKTSESYFFSSDVATELSRSESSVHWLYEVQESRLLQDFKARNPHINPHWDVKHYLVVVDNDVMDIIAAEAPSISERNDNVRGWIRPGEKRSE